MNYPRKRSLPELTKEHIKAEIIDGKYSPGEKLESVRQLTTRLNVSHVTTVNALKLLSAEGWIKSMPGAGSFVVDKLPDYHALPAERKTSETYGKTLYFFFTHDTEPGSYHSEVLCSLQRETEKFGWNLKIGMYADKKAVEEALTDTSAAGIVHASVAENQNPTAIPLINYGMNPSDSGNCCVSPDNYRAGFDAGKLLFERGLHLFHFVSVVEMEDQRIPYRYLCCNELYRGISDFSASRGISIPTPFYWSVPERRCQEVEEALLRVKKQQDKHLTLVVANRVMAAEIYQLLEKYELKVPDDVSILAFVSRGGTDMKYPISTFDFSREEMGRMLGRMLNLATLGYSLPSRIMLPMTFKDEGSL